MTQVRAIAPAGAENRDASRISDPLEPMRALIPPPLRGTLAMVLLGANTLFWCLLLMLIAIAKLALPVDAVRRRIDPVLNTVATAWIECNGAILWPSRQTAWDVQGTQGLEPDEWYMVTSNHQSWVDILVLQRQFSGRIPLLKFFLKQQLIYVPVIGLAWWALDFPFMKRHDKNALRKHPELRLKDRESAQRACEKFALVPTSVMTFPEGTRRTARKQTTQATPYRHLLKPKAGSLAMSLNAMGDRFKSLLDVTIVYPDGVPTFWDFLCGRCHRVIVRARQIEITPELSAGDYTADSTFRRRFHHWLDTIWKEKDAQIEDLLRVPPPVLAP
jgi:1-acyl-sn-glycerol-3-phosphate acyltransferase